jgi:hypothetical protein
MKPSEKRKMERYRLEVPARMTIHGAVKSEEEPLEVKTKDVCANGAFLTTDCRVAVGACVDVCLLLSFEGKSIGSTKRSQVEVKGTVVRWEADGMAVQFEKQYRIVAI